MKTEFAPIALFVFRRPDHTKKVLEALAKCTFAEDSELYIFCDAAKNPAHQKDVEEVRRIVKSQKWCKSVHVIEREKNLGLANSIEEGVSKLCREYGRAIILEDDILVSKNFLIFMNESLKLYQNDERVMQITGYNYPPKIEIKEDAFFILHSSCWGWATWDRAWKKFTRQSNLLTKLESDRVLKKRFDMDDSYPYTEMLQHQLAGKIDSWGVLWYASIFEANGLVLMPRKTLVKNFGTDGSGTHGKGEGFADELSDFLPQKYPPVKDSPIAYRVISDFLRQRNPPFWRKMLRKIVSKVR